MSTLKGKVKWFNSKKGYGFITEDETEKDIFLHVSALEESKLNNLKEEQHLEFETKEENIKSMVICNRIVFGVLIIVYITFEIYKNYNFGSREDVCQVKQITHN